MNVRELLSFIGSNSEISMESAIVLKDAMGNDVEMEESCVNVNEEGAIVISIPQE